MNDLAKQIKQLHPQLMIELLLMDLQGAVETIPLTIPTGQALAFDGVNDWLSTAKNLPLSLNQPVSFEFLAQFPTSSTFVYFFDAEQSTSPAPMIYHDGNNQILVFRIYGEEYRVSNFDVDDSWHHYAVTFDKTNVNFYLDGGTLSTVLSNIGSKAMTGSLRIGANNTGNTLLKGQLDEFRVWNYARTRDEIMADRHSELTGKEEGLVLYYNFNQEQAGSGNAASKTARTATDISTSKNNGTLTNFELTGTASNWVAPSEKTTSGPS